jgi:uncharacterized protein (TIGR02217 family)
MAFHEVRFPTALSFGSVGGPERRTEIVTLANGHEERNSLWQHSRRRYDAGIGMRSLDDLQELLAFFEARSGRLHGFRWKDWSDFKSCRPGSDVEPQDQKIGFGDASSTEFTLQKLYQSGGAAYTRAIAKPVLGTVRIAVDGVELVDGIDWVIDPLTGNVMFTVAPGAGTTITSGFEFDVPVRFDTDSILVSAVSFQAGEIPDVPVIEVRV